MRNVLGTLEQHSNTYAQWVTKEEMAQPPQSRVQGRCGDF